MSGQHGQSVKDWPSGHVGHLGHLLFGNLAKKFSRKLLLLLKMAKMAKKMA
jgi:hypothetical protein